MSSVGAFVILFPVLLVLLLIPILIGVYVYRDAKRRQMNAVVWTLVAILAPTFIGFIIYLLVRSNYADLACPRCGTPVAPEFVVCPQCGTLLRPACPSCRTPVEPDWKVCPKCAAPLPEEARQAAAPVRRKDSSLWKLLIVIVLIPLLLFGLVVLAMTSLTGSGAMSFREVTREELQAYVTEDQMGQIDYAVQSAELEANTACAFRYTREEEGGNTYYYLLYVPGGSDSPIPASASTPPCSAPPSISSSTGLAAAGTSMPLPPRRSIHRGSNSPSAATGTTARFGMWTSTPRPMSSRFPKFHPLNPAPIRDILMSTE